MRRERKNVKKKGDDEILLDIDFVSKNWARKVMKGIWKILKIE